MSDDAGQYVCTQSRSALHSADGDGARCSLGKHWHPRVGGGFVGARLVLGPPTYRELPVESPKPLPTPEPHSEGGDR